MPVTCQETSTPGRPVLIVKRLPLTLLQFGQSEVVRHHLMQTATDEVRVAAQQTVEPRDLRLVLERRAVAFVQFRDLFEGEVFQLQSRADVEGRLGEVGDERGPFGGVGDGGRQPLPRSRRVKRAFVVPRTEKTEDLAAEIAGEETINFIQPPDDRRSDFQQRLATQILLKVDAGATV